MKVKENEEENKGEVKEKGIKNYLKIFKEHLKGVGKQP